MTRLVGAGVVPGDDIIRVNNVYFEETQPEAGDEGVTDTGFDEGTFTSIVPITLANARNDAASGYTSNLSYGTYLTPPWGQFGLVVPTAQLTEGGTGSIETWGLVGE